MRDLLDEIVDLITRASGNLVLQLWRNTLRPALAEHLDLARERPPFDEATTTTLCEAICARDPTATEEAVHALLRQRREKLLAPLEESSAH